MTDQPAPEEIDATGLLCPLPVLRARKRMKAMAEGTVVRVSADDPAAAVDVPHFCAEQGHALLDVTRGDGDLRVFTIRRGPAKG
jgi:tRNA 2-thiouridine synthesizing protein A